MQMINFFIYSSAKEHPYERTVSKLIFYKSFRKNTRLYLKLTKFDSLAKTDSLLPASLYKENTFSLKFRFLTISKSNNFCLLLSQFFSFPIFAETFSFLYPETSKWYLGLISCYSFQTF